MKYYLIVVGCRLCRVPHFMNVYLIQYIILNLYIPINYTLISRFLFLTARTPFQHSPRTERQLSPHATIRHLQYNSPINLYSPQTAAEQYIQQTGGLFGTE